jgi:hypothetical protein
MGATFTRKWNKIQQERRGNTMRSSKANAFVYLMGVFVFALWLSGCGGSTTGSGTTTPPSNPTVLSVALTGVTASLQAGATAQAACTVTMSDSTTNSNCTFASDATAVASIGTTTGTVTAIAAGTAHLTATSTKDSTKSSSPFTLTVTAVPVPATITSVTVTATSNTITTAQTAQVTAVVTGTGSFSSAVTWTATGGAISGTGNTVTLTPSGVGTATATATSTADSTKSGSASIAVTRATPVISSVTLLYSSNNWIFCPESCNKALLAFAINCAGCQAGDQISFSGYWPVVTLTSANISADGKQVVIGGTEFGGTVIGANQPPGFIYFTDVPTDGTANSNTKAFAYVADYNYASHGATGSQLLSQYLGKAYVWQNASGTITNTLSFASGGGSNTVYETDGTNAYFVNNFDTYALDGEVLTTATSPDWGWSVSGTSAENGTVTVVQPGGNEITLYHPSATTNPIGTDVTVGTMPYTSVMSTISGTTYEFVISVDGTPTLWKLDTKGTFVGSTPLTGFTSFSDTRNDGVVVGGWPMAIFRSGTNAGKVVVASTYNKELLVFDGTINSMPLLNTVQLPCEIPSAVDTVDATGELVVSCINVAGFYDSGTTFLSINPSTGTVTTLAATSAKFPTGFLADANSLYVFQGPAAPDVLANK